TTATLSPASPDGQAGWYTTPVQVTLGAADDASGVASTTYTVDGGPPQTYSSPFTLPTDGTHVVAYSSTDNAGNAEQVKQITVKVDVSNPPPPASIAPAERNGWYATPTVMLTGNDGAGSGIDGIFDRVDGSGAFELYTGPLTGFTTGNHFVQ